MKRIWILLGVGVCLAAVAGWIASLFSPSNIALSLFAIVSSVLVAIAIALADRKTTIFDPVYVSSAAFAVLFFARPLYDYLNSSFEWVYIDVSSVMSTTMPVVAIAVLSFFIGSLVPIGKRIAHSFPMPPSSISESRLLAVALVLVGLAVLLRLVEAVLAGGLSTLLKRRELIEGGGENIAIISEGVAISVPAFLIFLNLIRSRRPSVYIGFTVSLALILQTAYAGNRRYLLSFLVTVVAFHFLSRQARPRLIRFFMAGAILFFGFIAPIELSRSGQFTVIESISRSFTDPLPVAESLLMTSQSTSMVNAFALIVKELGPEGELEYRLGLSTLTETVLQPIPRQIWSEKPQPIRTIMIEEEWGWAGGTCASLCPTFSALGTFYSDLGPLSVGIGSAALGVLLRIPSDYYRRFPGDFFSSAIFSVSVMVPFFVWWGSLSSVVLSLGTGIIPLMFAARFSRVPVAASHVTGQGSGRASDPGFHTSPRLPLSNGSLVPRSLSLESNRHE